MSLFVDHVSSNFVQILCPNDLAELKPPKVQNSGRNRQSLIFSTYYHEKTSIIRIFFSFHETRMFVDVVHLIMVHLITVYLLLGGGFPTSREKKDGFKSRLRGSR